jgi:hypothetical protein
MGLMKFASMIAIIIVVTVVTSLVGEYVLKPLAATDMDPTELRWNIGIILVLGTLLVFLLWAKWRGRI